MTIVAANVDCERGRRVGAGRSDCMGWVIKIVWAAGVGAVVGLVGWIGAEPVRRAVEAAGWGVAVICLLRGVAVAGAGLGWFVLFPPARRPSPFDCALIRFLREGANALLPMTQVGGDVIGARALTLLGTPASLSAASVIVDVLIQAATQCLFAAIGLAALAATGRAGGGVGDAIAVIVAAGVPALGGFYLAQRPVGQRLELRGRHINCEIAATVGRLVVRNSAFGHLILDCTPSVRHANSVTRRLRSFGSRLQLFGHPPRKQRAICSRGPSAGGRRCGGRSGARRLLHRAAASWPRRC